MRTLSLDYADAEQLFRRMVFNVIARNCDDHTKNFAFLLKQGKPWALAPAYDICHAYKTDHQWVSQHSLSINGKRKDIKKEDMLIIGKSIKCKSASLIIDEIESIVLNWKSYANEVGVSKDISDAIFKTIKDWN